MTGFAQQIFLKEQNKEIDAFSFSLFQTLLKKGYFSYLEAEFAKQAQTPAEANLLAFVLLAARNGHLAVKINADEIIPSPHDFTGFSTEVEVAEEETNALIACLKVACSPHLHTLEDYVYIPRYYSYETQFLSLLKAILVDKVEVEIALEKVTYMLERQLKDKKLLPLQARAIEQSLLNPLTILTGGPGTGKTYTASHLIHTLWEALSEDEKKYYEIVVCAPTGKATAHLHASLAKLLSDDTLLSCLSSKTLHSLLGIKPSSSSLLDDELESITADLIIVDESSMIDASLMIKLLSARKKGSRIVLIGDKYQLPPVESGSFFADLCDMLPEYTVELIHCMRSELKSIINLSKAINEGDTKKVLSLFPALQPFDFKEDEIKQMQEQIIHLMLDHFPCTQEDEKEFSSFRVLSPIRKGFLGVDELNRLCALKLQDRAKSLQKPFVAPIMLSANDHVKRLYNGEVGLLFFREDMQIDYACFQEKRFLPRELPPYEYGYCLSVHKSQGSEFDHVLLTLPEGSEQFGKEALYTAVTRAKKSLKIVASDKILANCVARPSRRISSLCHRWTI
ncbi:MAG: exodeoxyribonuclease V subunit alpha [Chlamydiales bacterium]|nr:exodeoxyribonuclease V subunit alpha [Chlamydiales bacterium]